MIINYLIFATLISNIRFTESKIRVFIKNIVQQMCCPIHLLNFYHKGMEGNGIIRNSTKSEKFKERQGADFPKRAKEKIIPVKLNITILLCFAHLPRIQ